MCVSHQSGKYTAYKANMHKSTMRKNTSHMWMHAYRDTILKFSVNGEWTQSGNLEGGWHNLFDSSNPELA